MEKRAMGVTRGYLAKTLLFVLLFSFALFPAANSFALPGDIHTDAGTGLAGFSSDGLQATASNLYYPFGLVADANGNVYIADRFNQRIRKVDADGVITTVAGTGTAGFSGDGGPAVSAKLNNPCGLAMDAAGNMYIADRGNNRIRKIGAGGIITTIAGSGKLGSGGDGGNAVKAMLRTPEGVAVDGYGNVYISDTGNNKIRKVGTDGVMYTVAGTNRAGYTGDGMAATSSKLSHPELIWMDGQGSLYIADYGNSRIRKVDASGIITTVAGQGMRGFSGDGGPATSASLYYPTGITGDAAGNLYITGGDQRVRRVDPSGTISTFAGTGQKGYSGDGGPATSAKLGAPIGIALDLLGNVYISEKFNNRVRVVEGLTYSPPLTTIVSPPAGVTVTVPVLSITGKAFSAHGISFVEVSTDGGTTWGTASGTTSWSYQWSPRGNGSYKIMSRATDSLNNVQLTPTSETVTVNVDSTAPVSAISAPASGSVLTSFSNSITGTASDGTGSGVSKVEVSTNGGTTWSVASGTTSWSFAWTAPANGAYAIKTRATDSAGNVETPGAGVVVTVSVVTDGVPPASSIASPAQGAIIGGATYSITGTSNDGAGSGVWKVEVSTDGGATWSLATGTTSWSYTWTTPASGSYTIKTRATDFASNVETPGAGVGVTVDKTAPSSAITSPASGAGLKGTSVAVAGTAADGTGSGVAKVEVSTDGGATWSAATGTASWSYTWTLPADGKYTIKTRATDKAGNVQTPGSGVAVTVDKTAPTSAITSPAAGSVLTSLSNSITGTASDGAGLGVSKVEVSTDGGTTWGVATGTTSWSYSWTAPANGAYTIKTRATDANGNVQTPGAGTSVTVSVPAPPPPPPGTSQLTLTWDPSPSAGVTGYKLYIGTASGVYTQTVVAGNVTSYTVTNLVSGTAYYIVATSYDASGSESGYSNQVVKTAP